MLASSSPSGGCRPTSCTRRRPVCSSTRPARAPGSSCVDQGDQALPSTLPLDQSLVLAWWQLVTLVGGTVVLFAGAYVAFMRQEVRA